MYVTLPEPFHSEGTADPKSLRGSVLFGDLEKQRLSSFQVTSLSLLHRLKCPSTHKQLAFSEPQTGEDCLDHLRAQGRKVGLILYIPDSRTMETLGYTK